MVSSVFTGEEKRVVQALDDADLLAIAKEGDRDAFGQLAMRHVDAVFGYCFFLLRNRADAEDACQETFTRILDHLSKVDHFKPYLFRTARNVCFDSLKRARRSIPQDPADENSPFDCLPDSRPNPEEALAWKEEFDLICELLPELPRRKREALLLREAGMGYAEIAHTMGISEQKARVYVAEARQGLGERRRRYGVRHEMQTA